MQWAHALERLPKIGFVVERFGWCWCGFFNYWRRRFRLEDRRRLRQHAIAIGEHLFQILEWRRENPRGRRRRLSFAFSFVGDSIMLSLFCHRKWLEGPGSMPARQTMPGTQPGSNGGHIRKGAEAKIAGQNGARPARINYTCQRVAHRFEVG